MFVNFNIKRSCVSSIICLLVDCMCNIYIPVALEDSHALHCVSATFSSCWLCCGSCSFFSVYVSVSASSASRSLTDVLHSIPLTALSHPPTCTARQSWTGPCCGSYHLISNFFGSLCLPLARSLSHSLTYSLIHSRTHSPTHSFTH